MLTYSVAGLLRWQTVPTLPFARPFRGDRENVELTHEPGRSRL